MITAANPSATAVSPRNLIGQLEVESFNATIREQAYAKFSGAISKGEAQNLFGLSRFDALMTAGKIPPQQIDIIYNGWPQTLDEAQGRTGGHNPRLVAERFLRGASVRVRDLQWYDPDLDHFRREIQKTYLARSQINMYLTPSHRRGFDPHFDSDDVFIIQCHGRKRWRIYPTYDNQVPLPLNSTRFEASRYQPTTAFEDLVLECGDTLYIPRGVMHAAACESEESLHLTVSLSPLTINDVLTDALARIAIENESWRTSLFLDAPSGPQSMHALAARISGEIQRQLTVSVVECILAEHLESLHRAPDTGSDPALMAFSSSLPN